jgi:hypothetical protein
MNESNWQIIIADRGWVYVGRPKREGDRVTISDCYNVTRWAQGGLGRLAHKGPADGDALFAYGTVRIHVLGVLGAIECTDAVWEAWIDKQESGETKRRKR